MEDSRGEQDDRSAEATYRAIGLFIDGFSSVEYTLRYYLAVEVKLDMNYFHPVLTHDFALLCTAVHEVFGQTLETEEKKKELKQLIGRARELNDLRVKIVHGQWWPHFEGGTLLHVSRRSLKENHSAEMAAHLTKQAELTRQLFWELQLLLSHFVEPTDGSEPDLAEVIARIRAALGDGIGGA